MTRPEKYRKEVEEVMRNLPGDKSGVMETKGNLRYIQIDKKRMEGAYSVYTLTYYRKSNQFSAAGTLKYFDEEGQHHFIRFKIPLVMMNNMLWVKKFIRPNYNYLWGDARVHAPWRDLPPFTKN